MAKVYGQVPYFGMAGFVTDTEQYATDTYFATYMPLEHVSSYAYQGVGFEYVDHDPTPLIGEGKALVAGRVFLASDTTLGRFFSGRTYTITSEAGWDVAELLARRDDADFKEWILAGDDEIETQTDISGHGGDDLITYVISNSFGVGASVRFEGGAGNDTLIGGHPVKSILDGGEGVDLLKGGNPADELFGGEGNDRLEGGAGGDLLDGGDGIDAAFYVNSAAGVTVDLAAGTASAGESDGDSFVSIENIHGSLHDDALSGDDAANLIIAEAGADSLSGRGGADTLIGGDGDDRVDGGTNPGDQGDFLFGGAGDDLYFVDSPLDFVDEGGVFPMFGFGGADTIVSTADFFWDVYSVGEVAQVSEDVVDAAGDGVTLVGGVFDNLLLGHSGTDVLFGRGGSDAYRAGDGVDWMSLSTLGVPDAEGYVANGANTVIIDPRASGEMSYDIVFEFENGRDRLDVSAYSEIDDFASGADVLATGVEDGAGNTYFALGDGFDYLFMVDRDIADFSAADFIV